MQGTLLVTGFEPFGGEPINPAELVAQALGAHPPAVGGMRVVTASLPVDVGRLREALDQALSAARPTALLMLGQAAGRATIDLETLAVNQLAYGEAVDNGGHRVADAPIDADGPARLQSTLPFPDCARELARRGHPVSISRDAGRYLCNFVLYDVLRRYPRLPAGFVHLPLLPEQSQRRALGEPALEHERSLAAVRALVEALVPRLRPPASA